MDDMTMLADLGSELDQEPPATLVRQRHRLIEASRGRPAHRRRYWPVLAGSVAVATAAAVAIVVVEPHAPAHRPTAPPTAIALSAALVLDRAADAAEQDPDVPPTAHQWIYQRMAEFGTRFPRPVIHDSWTRFDGAQDAYIANGRLAIVKPDNSGKTLAKSPADLYAWLRTLPTDPKALLTVLEQQIDWGDNVKPTNDQKFASVLMTFWNTLIGVAPPATRAAIYRAIATFPGVRLLRVTDGLGRHDLGVTERDIGTTLLLDPTTYRFVGYEVMNQPQPGQMYGLGVEADKVVDNPGDR